MTHGMLAEEKNDFQNNARDFAKRVKHANDTNVASLINDLEDAKFSTNQSLFKALEKQEVDFDDINTIGAVVASGSSSSSSADLSLENKKKLQIALQKTYIAQKTEGFLSEVASLPTLCASINNLDNFNNLNMPSAWRTSLYNNVIIPYGFDQGKISEELNKQVGTTTSIIMESDSVADKRIASSLGDYELEDVINHRFVNDKFVYRMANDILSEEKIVQSTQFVINKTMIQDLYNEQRQKLNDPNLASTIKTFCDNHPSVGNSMLAIPINIGPGCHWTTAIIRRSFNGTKNSFAIDIIDSMDYDNKRFLEQIQKALPTNSEVVSSTISNLKCQKGDVNCGLWTANFMAKSLSSCKQKADYAKFLNLNLAEHCRKQAFKAFGFYNEERSTDVLSDYMTSLRFKYTQKIKDNTQWNAKKYEESHMTLKIAGEEHNESISAASQIQNMVSRNGITHKQAYNIYELLDVLNKPDLEDRVIKKKLEDFLAITCYGGSKKELYKILLEMKDPVKQAEKIDSFREELINITKASTTQIPLLSIDMDRSYKPLQIAISKLEKRAKVDAGLKDDLKKDDALQYSKLPEGDRVNTKVVVRSSLSFLTQELKTLNKECTNNERPPLYCGIGVKGEITIKDNGKCWIRIIEVALGSGAAKAGLNKDDWIECDARDKITAMNKIRGDGTISTVNLRVWQGAKGQWSNVTFVRTLIENNNNKFEAVKNIQSRSK